MIAARNVPSISGLANKPEMTQSNPSQLLRQPEKW
jgi:hypothetical protein